jgi:hypothetical protein
VFDDQAKGKMIALLALGLSIRQAASVLGVSHTTVGNALKADPALSNEINAARFHAQLQPLACVIRESRRSWKAATWLLKYLDAKIKYREETPEECDARYKRQSDEFFGRAWDFVVAEASCFPPRRLEAAATSVYCPRRLGGRFSRVFGTFRPPRLLTPQAGRRTIEWRGCGCPISGDMHRDSRLGIRFSRPRRW